MSGQDTAPEASIELRHHGAGRDLGEEIAPEHPLHLPVRERRLRATVEEDATLGIDPNGPERQPIELVLGEGVELTWVVDVDGVFEIHQFNSVQ
jgi:hypothetical protein